MNNIVKYLLYFVLFIIIINILLLFILTIDSYKKDKDIVKSYNRSVMTMVMGYTFLFLGLQEIITGKKKYVPRGIN
jgi:hypothetical protein